MNLLNHFPKEIPFYDIGKITLNHTDNDNINNILNRMSSAFIYKISCNKTLDIYYMILPQTKEIESSMASEMGNIIASQVVSKADGLILFPPKAIDHKMLTKIVQTTRNLNIKNYQYFENKKKISMPILFLKQETKGELNV